MSIADTIADATPRRGLAARGRAVLGGTVGNLVEWYDWYAYPSFALYFSKSFFPQQDQTAQLLNAAAIYAIGFMIRPLGSWWMGLYADRKGRKPALMLSMAIMGLGSLATSVIPTYGAVGVLAPILLVLIRGVQGLSLGGQYGASATYVSEMAGRERRGFWSGIFFVMVLVGLFASELILLVLQSLLSNDALIAWGWRIPFAIGAVLAGAALIMTLRLEETGSFTSARRPLEPAATWASMGKYWRELYLVFIITGAGTTLYQNDTIYMPKFLVNTAGFSAETAAQVSSLSVILFMAGILVMGWLSDHYGRRSLLIAFGALTTISTVPLMMGLAHAATPTKAFTLLALGLIFLAPYAAVSAIYKAELFPPEIRALGVGLPYALANAVFGGTAEVIALALKQRGHEDWYYWLLAALMAAAFISVVAMRGSQRYDHITED